MLELSCSGTPYQIGQQHGRGAKAQVQGSLSFYNDFFRKKANMSWPEACNFAVEFVPMLTASWPLYIEEMKGVADGAGVEFASILALNVRTEIAYGMASDGCTAFSWKTDSASFLAQNWDWDTDQSPNIICLHIKQDSIPAIHMMTEAGILGKIGLNSSGVGVTLNAVQAKGVDYNRLPCHLALRTVLESTSREEAASKLLRAGVASSCHITIADAESGAIGLECSAFDIVELPMSDAGICTHSNHFVRPHVTEGRVYLQDSLFRLDRVQELLKSSMEEPSMKNLTAVLKDEKNYPQAICRAPTEKSTMATLFSVVMDLGEGYAKVKMGRPTRSGQELVLRP